MSSLPDRARYLRLVYRLPLAILHMFIATPLTVLFQFGPFRRIHVAGKPFSIAMSIWWSQSLCRIFGLEHQVTGEFHPGAQLLVANHISWIDIMVLHSLCPVGFVAKAEINEWPVLGFVARSGGTVFHRRGSHNSASGVATVMADRLREGYPMAIFPEGGILPGAGIKRFHARLFAAAIEAQAPVQPVMLRYLQDGRHYDEITFLKGEHFVGNFFRLLTQRKSIADVHVLTALNPADKQRRELASSSEQAIRAAFESGL